MLLKILKKYNRYSKDQKVEVSGAEATNLLKRGVAEKVKKETPIEPEKAKEEKEETANKESKTKLETK